MRKVKRKYESRHRKVLANQTRAQILEAARKLFRTKGYGRVTIEAIAKAAGVSAPTVYATFGGKRAILLKLLDEIEQAADTDALIADLADAPDDARKRLRIFVDFSVRLFTRGADVVQIVELAGMGDPDASALWHLGGERRLETCKLVIAGWAAKGVLRKGLSEDAAVDFLWAIAGAEFYGSFVRSRGWSPERFGNFLYQLAAEQLFGIQNAAKLSSRP